MSTSVETSAPGPLPEAAPPPRWGVVVVHGVGETDPGTILNNFVPAFLQMRGLSENTVEERRVLEEADGSKFPMPTRRVDLSNSQGTGEGSPVAGGPRQAIFAEVYWADLSRCGDTPWDLVIRLFTIIFRVYYLTQQAARMPGTFSWLLRLSLYFISGILCGPIAALNGFMLLILIAHGVYLSQGFPDVEYYAISVVGLVGLVLALAFLIPARRSKGSYPWSLALLFLAFEGVALIALGILEARDVIEVPGVSGAANVLLSHFELLLLLNRWLFLAVGALTALAVFFWFFAVLSSLGHAYWRRYIPGLTAGLTATLLQLGLWVIMVPTLAFIGMRLFLPRQLEGPPFDRIWSLFLFNLTAGLAVIAVGMIAWLWRWVRIQLNADPPKRGGAVSIPRILVHPLILGALILATLAGIVAFAVSFVLNREPLYHQFFMDQVAWIGPVLMAAMALVFLGFVYRPVRNALHILMDIISHFHRTSVRFPVPLSGRKESKALPKEDALRDYFIQERIERRLQIVLREMMEMGVTHLTIVAHSQGAMIAVDTLWFSALTRLLRRGKGGPQVYLVTLGAPVTHLYQHYFPWRYGPLFPGEQPEEDYLQPWGAGLEKNLDGWKNLFRVNDFIGRHIEGKPGFPDNVCFPKVSRGGGHTGYWSDQVVLAEMEGWLPG